MTRFADETANAMDLAGLQARLEGARGPQFWRSLEELAGSEEFQEYLHREFPRQASEWTDPTTRRQFLTVMGASLALAGVSGCAYQPTEHIVPYVKAPEDLLPGRPLFFATAFPFEGYGLGVLVESHTGRPTKIEGNPAHPASLGSTDVFAQASILSLYDPDRSQSITRNGRVSTYDDLLATLIDIRGKAVANRGRGLRILTESTTSPTELRLIGEFLEAYPEARWYRHDPVDRSAVRDGTFIAFGKVVEPITHFDKADIVVALDADFLYRGPNRVAAAREFANRREPDSAKNPAGLNRLYVAESMPTVTGSIAEHRLPVPASRIAALAARIAERLGVQSVPVAGDVSGEEAKWLDAVVADLEAHRGSSLVLVGEDQPVPVHALVNALNHALGNIGETVTFVEAPGGDLLRKAGALAELVEEMDGGQVDTLVILGGNPAFTSPADIDFAGALEEVRLSIALGEHDDETALLCNWHVPQAHFLESWGDIRSPDGSATVQQPLIAPLYDGKTSIEILSALIGQPNRPSLQLVRDTWRATHSGEDFETFWRSALHQGIIPGTTADSVEVAVQAGLDLPGYPDPSMEGGTLELVLKPDPCVWDGRFANNAWLQELPKPLTKLTWDNAAMMSKATADRLGVVNEQLVELSYRGRTLELPVWIVPGHANDSVTVHLGYGRRRVGRVGDGIGFDAYALADSKMPCFGSGLEVRRLDRSYPLATTQHHFAMEGRELVRSATVSHFQEHPDFAKGHHAVENESAEGGHHELSLFEKPPVQARREAGEGNSWGMVINLNTCIGCNVCVVACQAENNIPVVGKMDVRRGREMHWIRVDRYYEGSTSNPKTYHQPVPCMHCERAPCELVCPVAATSHSPEGLNEMTYNRCVGTRYCNNNCPFKVRRFNFIQYADLVTPSLKLQRNPDVTVRTRGVMEKCTYCVQRISRARIDAEVAYERGERPSRVVKYGEVETACQGACPTRAITFGNLNDPDGEVARQKKDPRNYAILAELNVQPRTTYLAKLTNPHTVLDGGESQTHE